MDPGQVIWLLLKVCCKIYVFERSNINAVRTCHYPDNNLWYDCVIKYGLYVLLEANIGRMEWGNETNIGLKSAL